VARTESAKGVVQVQAMPFLASGRATRTTFPQAEEVNSREGTVKLQLLDLGGHAKQLA
jgi:hypothetical protein